MSISFNRSTFTQKYPLEKPILDWDQWVVNHLAVGDVLDIGCGSGLTDINLAKNSFQVLGMDCRFDLITAANRYLFSEPQSLHEKITFLNEDFLIHDFMDLQFSGIMLNVDESFELLSNNVLEKVHSLLLDEGRVIITIPFGLKDFYLSDTTYSLSNICKFVSDFINIDAVQFWNNRLSLAGGKRLKELPGSIIQDFLVLQMVEDVFQMHLRDLSEKVRKSSLILSQLKNNNASAVNWLKADEKQKTEEERETLIRTIDLLTLDGLRLRAELDTLKELYVNKPASAPIQTPVIMSKKEKLAFYLKKLPVFYRENGYRATVHKVFSKVSMKLLKLMGRR